MKRGGNFDNETKVVLATVVVRRHSQVLLRKRKKLNYRSAITLTFEILRGARTGNKNQVACGHR